MINRKHQVPCLHCHPHSFIRMVQHLIERCLLLHMTRDDCIRALQNHARINPIITLTVWEELRKENPSFFQAYFHAVSPRHLVNNNDQTRRPPILQKESRAGDQQKITVVTNHH